MKRMPGVLLLLCVALPVWADDMPDGCARLCGSWVLEPARSDAVETVVDAALANFVESSAGPRPSRSSNRNGRPGSSGTRMGEPAHEERGGDLLDDEVPLPPLEFEPPPTKEQFRAQLVTEFTPAPLLTLGERRDEILIHIDGAPDRRISPGEPHSRVDSLGTAKIRAEWKKDALVINESYGSKRQQTETYALQPDGTLLVTRVVERAGVKNMRLRVAYHRL